MTETDIREFRQSNWRFVVSISGGGSAFISDYLALPGASATFLEAIVPYAQDATDAFLGFRPESYCSEKTARLLASQAFRRAGELDARARERNEVAETPLVGIGVSAALASDRPKKGAHRVYCAIRTSNVVFSATLRLTKNARERAQEERLAADFAMSALLFATRRVQRDLIEPWREHKAELVVATEPELLPDDDASISWATLDEPGTKLIADAQNSEFAALRRFHGKTDRIRAKDGSEKELRGSEVLPVPETARAIYPGSFNPPHEAHAEIARLAAKRLGVPVELEISARNVDKPPVDALELARRLEALERVVPDLPVWISNAPRYVEKAAIFRDATFVMGTDTILRLANPKYEGNSIERRDAVLDQLQKSGASFCVFKRKIKGEIVSQERLFQELPEKLRARCDFVPQDEYLNDLSSSAIRKNARLS